MSARREPGPASAGSGAENAAGPASRADAREGTGTGTVAGAVAGAVAGTVAILGRPNVGKSTLLNRIVGEKLAIVSPKPQTTRNRILGVWNGDAGQIVFVDTPGVHAGRGGLGRFMSDEVLGVIEGADAALLLVEPPASAAAVRVDAAERRVLDLLVESRTPTVLAINKVDKVKHKPSLLPVLKAWQELGRFAALVPLSAQKGTGVPALLEELRRLLPQGPPLYGPDMLTDRTERFLAAELVREQVFLALRQELPYATAVVIEAWNERQDRGDVVIDAAIIVERDSQKSIMVGRGGAMIREIGTRARPELTRLLGRPAHLKLFVKVEPDWSSSPAQLAELGYRR
jgi:GTPase